MWLRQYWSRHQPAQPYLFASRSGKLPTLGTIRKTLAKAAILTGKKFSTKAFCSVSVLALDVSHRASVRTGRSSIRFHVTECFPEVFVGDHSFERHLPWERGRLGRAARLRLDSCPVRQARTPRSLDTRGRLPSSLRDWGTVSRAFRYCAAIRLLSSLHHFVLSFSAVTECSSRSEAERSPWVRH